VSRCIWLLQPLRKEAGSAARKGGSDDGPGHMMTSDDCAERIVAVRNYQSPFTRSVDIVNSHTLSRSVKIVFHLRKADRPLSGRLSVEIAAWLKLCLTIEQCISDSRGPTQVCRTIETMSIVLVDCG
jgi:hypothetical protein